MLKTLAINSLPAYGNAGLKCILSVLQTTVVPVPSVILSGLGNIAGHQRFSYPFEENLNRTLQHLRKADQDVVLYVGYLGEAAQIEAISRAIPEYGDIIRDIVIDPVCGDNGKPYVPDDIIKAWPKLLNWASWATPNFTEISLLTGLPPDEAMEKLKKDHPTTCWIVTSYPIEKGYLSNRVVTRNTYEDYITPILPQKISGAGDTFTSYFILEYIHKNLSLDTAMDNATKQTLSFISQEEY